MSRYLYPNSHRRRRNVYRKSNSDLISAFRIIKFMFKMIIYVVSGIFAIVVVSYSFIYKVIKRIKDYRHYKDIGMNSLMLRQSILKLDGLQFEIFCTELYKAMGHKVKRTQSGNDHGRDCIIDKNIFVECKHYTGNSRQIGREICQKLIGSMEFFDIKKGIIFTTGKIHNNAYEYAKGLKYKSLKFVDLNEIISMLYSIDINRIPLIMSKSMAFTDERLLKNMDTFNDKIENFSNNLDEQY